MVGASNAMIEAMDTITMEKKEAAKRYRKKFKYNSNHTHSQAHTKQCSLGNERIRQRKKIYLVNLR